jgi:hypothetical protein
MRQNSEFSRITRASRTLPSPINRPIGRQFHRIDKQALENLKEKNLEATFRSCFLVSSFPFPFNFI